MPGGLYHVIVRGNERRAVFRDDADRERYLEKRLETSPALRSLVDKLRATLVQPK